MGELVMNSWVHEHMKGGGTGVLQGKGESKKIITTP
jgi:hypothetical protein